MRERLTGPRSVLVWMVGTVLIVLAVLAVVLWFAPDGAPTARRLDQPRPDAAVLAIVRVDSFDAARASLQARLQFLPGPKLPESGALVVTNLGSMPPVAVVPGRMDAERVVSLDAVAGDVIDYPFDRYAFEVAIEALTDASIGADVVRGREPLDVDIVVLSTVSGFSSTRSSTVIGGVRYATATLERDTNIQAWVVAMMGLYWAMAVVVCGLVLIVTVGRRQIQLLHLSWLTTMIFAMSAFRTTAPGSPPIGTFFDYAAVFPTMGIVTVALVVLSGAYLVHLRHTADA